MGDFVIMTDGLSRKFGDSYAVDSVNLAVPEGSIYGFLGPNGAGKTTTIRMLLGLIRPTKGEVHLFGQSPRKNRQLYRDVGAMVEGPALYGHLTGRENLELTRKLLNVDKARIDEVLDIVSMADAASKLVRDYSLGMKQRTGIAQALLSNPKLLILDEPTNGLDPRGIQEIRNLIRRLPQEHNITVFLSSHLLSEVEQVASHIGVINHGKLIYQDTLASLQVRRKEFIKVGAFNPQQAIDLLRQAGYQVEISGEMLHIEAKGRDEAAQVNRSLIGQDEDIFHLTMEQLTLEDIFLQMTEDTDGLDTRIAG